jgi:hypothetical protein
MEVTVRTPIERIETLRSQSSDVLVLRDRFVIDAVTITPTPGGIATFSPLGLGTRAAALGNVFTQYRFKDIAIKFMTAAPGSASINVLGVYDDDPTASSSEIPTTFAGVVDLRCATTDFTIQTTPSLLFWKPIDPSRWYYTQLGGTGADPRFSVSAVLYGAANTGSTSVVAEVDYTLVFKGASQ